MYRLTVEQLKELASHWLSEARSCMGSGDRTGADLAKARHTTYNNQLKEMLYV